MGDVADQMFRKVREAPQKGAPLYLQLKKSIEDAVNSGVHRARRRAAFGTRHRRSRPTCRG